MTNKCDGSKDKFSENLSPSGRSANLKSLNKGSFAKSNANLVEQISNSKNAADFYQICRFRNGEFPSKKVLQMTNTDTNSAPVFAKNCENVAKKVSLENPGFKVAHSYAKLTASCNNVTMSLDDLKSKSVYYETATKNKVQEASSIYCGSACKVIECGFDGCTDEQIALLGDASAGEL